MLEIEPLYEPRPIYFDKDGSPLNLMEWAYKFELMSYRIVSRTKIDKYEVSTVWIGLDQDIMQQGVPIIFETMIFCADKDDEFYHWIDRYSTLEEAQKGHFDACNMLPQQSVDEM